MRSSLTDIDLPLAPAKLAAHIHAAEGEPPAAVAAAAPVKAGNGRALHGRGATEIAATPERIWHELLDPATLAAVIPGAHGVEKVSDTEFHADVTLGVGPVKGRYHAKICLSDMDPPKAVTLSGQVTGLLGSGGGTGRIRLTPVGEGRTELAYDYEAEIGGKVAAVGGRLLDGAARFVIRQFFEALSRKLAGGEAPRGGGLFARLRGLFGRRA